MKKLLSILLVVGVVFSFTSCEDEEVYTVSYFPIIVNNTINDAIAYETSGLDFMTYQASLIATESIENPQEIYSDTISSNNTWENGWTNYQYSYSAVVTSEGIEFTSVSDSEYETFLMKSEDSANNQWVLTNILAESDFYNLSGITIRSGNQFSKTYKDSFDSTVEFNFQNLEVNRITGDIKNGTVSFKYTGKSSYGEVYTCSGEVRYSDYKNVTELDK